MKITKYEHACLVLEEQGKQLVIDPGIFSTSLPELTEVVAVVVTHIHPDHFDQEKLQAIFAKNPEAQLYTVPAVAAELKGKFAPKAALHDMGVAVGPFHLEFFGEQHAVIHNSIPLTDNVGVLVNETLYYPGDSFTLPDETVEILAVPASAPWMKVSEAIDFIEAIRPKIVFPTHNALLSEQGTDIHNRLLGTATEAAGGSYQTLATGQTVEA